MNLYKDYQAELRKRYKLYCKQYNKITEKNDNAEKKYMLLLELRSKGVKVEISKPVYIPTPHGSQDFFDLTCGAKTRAGTPCKLKILYDNGRCKFHGGLSTGAKTKEGKMRQREGQIRALKAYPMKC